MKAKSVPCPKHEDHAIHKKIMFFLVEDGIFVFCKKHLWIKFEFIKGEEKISFKDVRLNAYDYGNVKVFDHEPIEFLAYGEFKPRNAKYSQKL